MDKLAPVIAWTKENGFWLMNGLLLLLMIGIWFMQTGNLKEQQSSNEGKIKAQFNTASGIMRQTPDDIADADVRLHPNRTTKEGMQAELERTVASIVAAWQLRVDTQKKLLVFPELGSPRFNEIFGRYNPPETFPVEYTDGEIEGLLGLYNSKIQDHMIKLCGKDGVRTNWRKDPDNYEQTDEPGTSRSSRDSYGDEYGGGGGLQVEDEDAARFAVLWSEVNQALWFDKLTVFQDRDDHSKSSIDPTPLQCYMLQQDLWVLESMFNVIRELNGDSTAIDTSAIKQIDHIGIGREGNVQLGELHPVDSRLAPKGGGDSEEGESEGEYGSSAPGGYESGGTGNADSQYEDQFSEEEPVATDEYGDPNGGSGEYGETTVEVGLPPFHKMYVDTKFEPISSAEVLKVVKGEELPESHLELIIAKRLPVRIALKMDERKISDFMAASINSPFSFEIQQVRINRHTPGGEQIDLGGGGGGLNRGIDGYGGGSDDRSSSFDDVSRAETRTNYDVNVEFFGIIKIYNPVRADLIRKAANIEEDQEESLDSAANRGGSAGRTAG